MLTLAVDTSGDMGSITLIEDDRVLEERGLQAGSGFSHTLFGEIEAMLARQKRRLADIDLYAAANGPGSFTGIRVGLAAIKGLAEVAGKPAVGISNLQALAEFGSRELRAPVIDARRGEVFAALYRSDSAIILESVLPLATFIERVGDRAAEWITSGFDIGRPVTTAPTDLAAAIARLAVRKLKAGENCDPILLEANYVRRSDAEIFWKD
jgi:tRNA threonylcarbamoyladenosine biosynthesis protein TsaB